MDPAHRTTPFLMIVGAHDVCTLFARAINRDILAAFVEAEAGRYRHPEFRLWVTAQEVVDGL